MKASAELLMLLLADARLPVGNHTQSAGLEPALLGGLPEGEIERYLTTRLDTVTPVEAGTAVVALYAIRHGASLRRVAEAWAARTVSAPLRSVSRGQGRALLRLLAGMWPDQPQFHDTCLRDMPRPVVLAAAANAAGLSAITLARIVAYDDAQTVAAAALKLVPMDPASATFWVQAALPRIEAVAAGIAHLTKPAEIPVNGAPQFDAWANAHAIAERRLFSA